MLENIINNIGELLLYNPKKPILFNTGFFLWWFLILMLFYVLIHRKQTIKVIYLLVFSVYFYYKSSGFYFYLIFITTITDFFIAKWIALSASKQRKKLFLAFSLIINLGILGYFKYTNFFIQLINDISYADFKLADIFLPVGISFYTFQSLSYSIDVMRGRIKPLNSILDYAFFVTFFPQLVAGPIVKAREFIPQIHQKVRITKQALGTAIFLISSGLFKKAVISDYISINFVDRIFENPSLYTGFENLMGVYGYALQIYCDFSGYSDMAIGLALLLGFKIPENFNAPYKSASITEFWKRWHISLSTWFRDYVFMPLANWSSGRLKKRKYAFIKSELWIYLFAASITMFVTGFWHGPAWKFILWGVMHGVVMIFERFLWNYVKIPKTKLFRFLGILLTFHLVCLSWILFRASSQEVALQVLHQIKDSFHPEIAWQLFSGYKEVFVLILIGYLMHYKPQKWEKTFEKIVIKAPVLGKSLLLLVVIWLVIQAKSADVQPFIYFQF